MTYLSIVLEQLEIFVVYMLIGVIAVKTRVLDREKLGALSGCITKMLLPLLIFTNTVNGTTRVQFFESAVIILLAAALYLFLYIVSSLLGLVTGMKGNRKNVYRACTMFGNCGFMGIPVITALYPQQGGLYITLYTVIDQLALWTIGVNLTSPADGQQTLTGAKRLCRMINPATCAVVLGVLFVLAGVQLPAVIGTALSKTGAAASPLAMIYLGGIFCYIRIGDYLRKWEIYLTAAVKMILAPLAVYAVLTHIPGLAQDMAVTISILCALPTMSTVAMMAENQHSDGDYAAGMILVTTVLSIITLPFVCYLL